ncbi:MAG: AMP-binding protein [Chloroflexi bacterium]|nr:AMP-binding protein [Chloroflexota bacterium]
MSPAIWNKFQDNAIRHPSKAALIYFQQGTWKTVTYGQLLRSSQRFVSGLSACHLTSGMRAALMTPPSADFFALALAMLNLGIVPVIFDPAIGLKKAGECLNESQPEIFIGNPVTHTLRIIFGWGRGSVKHNLSIGKILNSSTQAAPSADRAPQPTDPAAVIYTSGSTGLPKGALYTRANFEAQLKMLKNTFNITEDEIDLPAFPLYALIDVLLGVTSVIPDITFPVPKNIDSARTLSAIQEYKVTNTFASPVVLDKLASYGVPHNIKLPSLKRVITAGAPATIQLQARFRKLLNDNTGLFGIYGATETLPIAKVESREIFSLKEKTGRGAGICLGRPVENVKIRIIKITDEPIGEWRDSLTVGSNVVGEITVQSPATTRRYIRREDANRLSKIKDGDEVIHRMGDVGYFDEQGRLWYCGRKSHRVITQEHVLFTEQIEGIFNAHPLVHRSALVGVDEKPVLWVELEQKAAQEKVKGELMKLAKDHAQASKIKSFLFMKRFPTDVRHNSKIIREELTLITKRRLT